MASKLNPVLRDPNNVPVDIYQTIETHFAVVAQDMTTEFPINCRGIRIAGDADIFYTIGTSSLGTNGMYLPKKTVEYLPLIADATFYLSAMGNGTFSITELN